MNGFKLRAPERGSTTLELAVWALPMLLFIALVIVAARMAITHQTLQSAAFSAAREASLVRTVGEASTAGAQGANFALSQAGIRCANKGVAVDTSAFSQPIGTTGQVSVTLSCNVSLADAAIPGLPGNVTITKTATSPIDPYRER